MRQELASWCCRPLSPYEFNDNVPDTGIGISVIEKTYSFEASESFQWVETAKTGYAGECERSAKAAAEKFMKYSNCKRLFLVQFFGDDSSCLLDDEIVEVIETAQLAEMVDQVWLAGQEWVID